MRRILSIAAGIATWFLLEYFFTRQTGRVRVMPSELITFAKVVRPVAELAALHIIPWLLTGILAGRTQIICGAIAAALASAIDSALSLHMYSDSLYDQQFLAIGAARVLVAAAYGAAASALGAQLARSNNSFKPKPLRGSA